MARAPFNHGLFSVISLTFVSLLGFPVISPALPSVQAALGISTQNVGWIMAAYSLPGLIFMPIVGLFADRFGKRRVIVPSLVLFSLAGSACALAPDQETLFVLRFIQGIGACALSALNVALVGDFFTGHNRVRVMGFVGATQNVGSGLLPLLGGTLAAIAWFYPFLVSLLGIPLGLYLLFATENSPPLKKKETRAFLGHAWNNLMDRRVLALIFMTVGFIFVGFGAFVTYLPVFMKDQFAAAEVLIGFILSSRAASGALLATQLGRIVQLLSYRFLISVSFLVLAIGMVAVTFISSPWALIFTAVCYGGSFGIVRPSLQVLLLDGAPEDLRGTFSSANSFGLRLAQTISPVAAGAFLAIGTFDQLYILAAILSVLMAIFAMTSIALRPSDS
tara:strand:+ start:347 stop:1519 length:1173 start_codon:yes stop_codon:yes gene_type:complete